MKKVALIILIPLLTLVIIASGAYFYVRSKIYVPIPKETISDITKTKDDATVSDYTEAKGITNILLVGLDGRNEESGSNTDSMIVASIDSNNKKVKLTSFMRDMYVPIPGHGQDRINSAFARGGPELLMKTMNQDFNLNIQYYVSINFKAFQSLVEKLGGVDVEVKSYELKEVNYYIKEANWSNPDLLKEAGFQHLNGQQALSYCRIRKVGNNDFERTDRQRRVLSILVNKAKTTSLLKLPDLFTTLLPFVKTNIPVSSLMNLGFTVYRFGGNSMENLRIPAEGAYEGMMIAGADVLVPNIEKNVNLLENFIFSSSGSLGTDMPAYVANSFHSSDKAIDKRGQTKTYVKIDIPKPTVTPKKDNTQGGVTPVDQNNSGKGDKQVEITPTPNPTPTGGGGDAVTPSPTPTPVKPTDTVTPTPTPDNGKDVTATPEPSKP